MVNEQEDVEYKEQGFTFIEVLLALFSFMICMLGLGALQLNAMKSVKKAEVITRATAFAHSRVELLKSLPMNDSKVTGNSEIIKDSSFWTQRIVIDDSPIGKRLVDTGSGYSDTTVCKTIEIKVFEDSAGKFPLASTRFIKSFAAVE